MCTEMKRATNPRFGKINCFNINQNIKRVRKGKRKNDCFFGHLIINRFRLKTSTSLPGGVF